MKIQEINLLSLSLSVPLFQMHLPLLQSPASSSALSLSHPQKKKETPTAAPAFFILGTKCMCLSASIFPAASLPLAAPSSASKYSPALFSFQFFLTMGCSFCPQGGASAWHPSLPVAHFPKSIPLAHRCLCKV